MFPFATVILTAFVAILAHQISYLIMSMGLNKRVYNHAPAECTKVGAFDVGVLDMDTSTEGILFMTKNNRHLRDSSFSGSLYAFYPENRSVWELTSKGISLEKLNLDGISFSLPKNKKQRLFAVNHQEKKDSVEILSVDIYRHLVKHINTVEHPLFHNLKDVAAVDEKRFYVSVHHTFDNKYLLAFERYLNFPYGQILFYNGEKVISVERSISTPAGIHFDAFRRILYVASMAPGTLVVYSVLADYNLVKIKEIPLYTSPHFIWSDLDGTIIAACHPEKLRYYHHEDYPMEYASPSHIIRIHVKPRSNKTTRIDQLFANDGATVKAATCGVRVGNDLLIGGSDLLISCPLPNYNTKR